MNEEILKRFVSERVSILLNVPKQEGGDKLETYNGIIEDVLEETLILDTDNDKFHIKKVVVNVSMVVSLWIYDKNWYKKQ